MPDRRTTIADELFGRPRYGYGRIGLGNQPRPAPAPVPVDALSGPRLRERDPLKPGRYTVELDVIVRADTSIEVNGRETNPSAAHSAAVRGLVRRGLAEGFAKRREIEWKPGDVVVFRHAPGSTPYTYVRGAVDWPGDRAGSRSDDFFRDAVRDGLAKPVLQQGGEPFDLARLS